MRITIPINLGGHDVKMKIDEDTYVVMKAIQEAKERNAHREERLQILGGYDEVMRKWIEPINGMN